LYHHIGIAHRFDAETVLAAYAHGFFPMGEDDGTIHWITSDPRFVLPIGGLHVPRSLARLDRKRPFEIRCDTAFRKVMEFCAHDRTVENRSWILPRMIDVYSELHRAGHAHSVEAWLGGVLVGGLYGVAIGGAFFGESMFTRRELGGANSSKLCLLELDRRLQRGGFALLDSQEANEHMAQFGGEELPFDEYQRLLGDAIQVESAW
jgi:leucyl/phenylalanyl-tRNA--protein transferase